MKYALKLSNCVLKFVTVIIVNIHILADKLLSNDDFIHMRIFKTSVVGGNDETGTYKTIIIIAGGYNFIEHYFALSANLNLDSFNIKPCKKEEI